MPAAAPPSWCCTSARRWGFRRRHKLAQDLAPARSHRRFPGGKLVIASHNEGKVREISALLASFGVDAVAAVTLGLDEPEETGRTFVANAELKARAAAAAANLPALADDSGLAVDALDGQPGIYSARWAGFTRDFGLAMERLNRELAYAGAREPEQRRAHFVCALSLAWPDGHCETFEGKVFGSVVWPPRGNQGFGYDPVFLPDDQTLTFGEMQQERKHAMSHRAEAFRQLVAACFAPAGAA